MGRKARGLFSHVCARGSPRRVTRCAADRAPGNRISIPLRRTPLSAPMRTHHRTRARDQRRSLPPSPTSGPPTPREPHAIEAPPSPHAQTPRCGKAPSLSPPGPDAPSRAAGKRCTGPRTHIFVRRQAPHTTPPRSGERTTSRSSGQRDGGNPPPARCRATTRRTTM
jgi:hypothetical protein